MAIVRAANRKDTKNQVRTGSIDIPKKNISKYLYTEITHDIFILSFIRLEVFPKLERLFGIDASIKMRGLRTGLGGNGDAIHNSDLLTAHSFHQVFESMTNLTNQAFQTTPLKDQKSEK